MIYTSQQGVIASGAKKFLPAMLGTVPRWDTSFWAVSGANIGITGAAAWSIQALVSADVIDPNAYRFCVQVGATSALNGAAFGHGNLDEPGARFFFTDINDFGDQARIWPVVNQWYLLTLTYDGTTLRLYVGGYLVASRAVALNLSNGTLIINGRRAHNAWFWDGPMCRIGQWARALSAAEVLACANNPLVSETLAPVRFYKCNEGAGNTLIDSGSAGDNATITNPPVWIPATSINPDYYPRIRQFMPCGDSMTAGTVLEPGSWRRTEWPRFSRPVSSVGEQTPVPDNAASYYNAGLSGDTIATAGTRLVGVWANATDYTIGSPGDPGPGNRGQTEITAARPIGQGGPGPDGMTITVQLGTNDATTGPISTSAFQVLCERICNVYRVAGTVRRLIVCTEIPRIDNATANGRITVFNAAVPGIVAALIANGFTAVLADLAAGFNTATMLGADGLHPNTLGLDHIGGVIRPLIEA